MAAATQYSNVMICANTNTFVGPCVISGVKVVASGGAGTFTLTSGASGTPVIYKSGTVADTIGQYDSNLDIRVPSGDTITVAATNCTGYVYTLYR